ncbi:exopolyphosphatase / guanosine-5'-triphosphate,3'-diphosphate pyrophosphatase [Thermosyntropha lipolytica DSM 11003]|uniref:Exopolyphosphatase / guanosine-5'-triphosphate,3'-diphosphate pyrophosphatase n=1 Tax=Thermosyntropha lipolytica DSM 11003 TaxID=1123382 RepID=A0A1M5JTD4_9FIRM|nr:Ppx/GppA phosphatase family protein [Thermosyntropha lipolytica]SHG43811.1 exopolyphosphatase / guanosine-5'-triphosphate,3'-diphosphate pyrophosphatase [Thermosyntropha lipolytica DSM 11003]
MRLGAVDVGTNSCRLLIAEKQGEKLVPLYRGILTTRLGENLLQTGEIGEKAIERTSKALAEFKKILQEYGVLNYRAVATSALREAANQRQVVEAILSTCGIEIEVISGEEEAYLSYLGVKKGLGLKESPLVVDLGGGSTEFILGRSFMLSLPLGAVRATEGNMDFAMMKEVLTPLIEAKIDFSPYSLVMVGGTATTLVAIKLKLTAYDPGLVHGQVLHYEEIADIYKLLSSLSLEERKKLPGLQPERADIIPKGVQAVLAVMEVLKKDQIIVSEADLMEGMLWEMLGSR